MAKNYNLGDFVLDVFTDMSGRVPKWQAEKFGVPEAAGSTPDMFKQFISQKDKEGEGDIKQRLMDVREENIRMMEKKNELTAAKAQADAKYRGDMLNYKKAYLGYTSRQEIVNNPAYKELSKAALNAMKVKDKTPEDIQILKAWSGATRVVGQKAGIDLSEYNPEEDPGFMDTIIGGAKSLLDIGDSKPTTKPAGEKTEKSVSKKKPVKQSKEDPDGLGI